MFINLGKQQTAKTVKTRCDFPSSQSLFADRQKEIFMKSKYLYLRNTVFLLLIVTLFSSMLMAQKKPTSLKLDVDGDDLQLCGGQIVVNNSTKQNNQGKEGIGQSQFCVLFRSYYSKINSNDFAGAQIDRNEMIEIVRGQVDTFYKLRKDGRRSKIRIFQTILDFLQIGGDLAITIMNGERARTVVGAVIAGLDNGNKVYNKNFEVLQTQVLVNKMNANRAEILVEIFKNKSLDVRAYSWYAAKNDLRRYLFAGTFDNALDSLVNETGADVADAEKELEEFGPQSFTAISTVDEETQSGNAKTIRSGLRKKLTSGTTDEKAAALKKVKGIVEKMEADDVLEKVIRGKVDSTSDDGLGLLNGLQDVIIEQLQKGRPGQDIINKMNSIFIKEGQ
jgi:hypothetical protein